jgi:peptide deformylase
VSLDVLTWPNPRLLEIAEDVPEVNEEVRAFAADLVETMYASGGVGLAATQVGVPWRIVAVDCSPRDPDAMPHLLINARIVKREGTLLWREGCLSLPGITAEVERAAKIEVAYLDGDGTPQTLTVEDLEAVCIQHELDHLDGVLYVDRLGMLEKKAALHAYDDIRLGRVVEEVELVVVEAE